MNCGCSENWTDAGKLFLRVVLGAIFFYHGHAKFGMDTQQVSMFFGSVGIPAASFFAVFVPWAEMIGGVAIILGIFTHWVSKVLVAIAAVALLTVHITKGFNVATGGYEFILLILAASFSVMTMGPGKFSVDARMRK